MKEPDWKNKDEVEAFLEQAAAMMLEETSKKIGFPLEKYPSQAGFFGCMLVSLLAGRETVEESRKYLVKYFSKPEVPRDTSIPQ